jgi:hypothetical protein
VTRLFSYVVRYDVGFAPNPFHGWCTLATCKPGIRQQARPGDWVVGTGSKTSARDGRLVFAMRVEEILTYQQYWEDRRFTCKRPSMRGSVKKAVGDNIYHRDEHGNWLQQDSRHTRKDASPNPQHIATDTSADAVLASQSFSYFGGAGPTIPRHLREGFDLVHAGPGYRSAFTPDRVAAAARWLDTLEPGYRSKPGDIQTLLAPR